MTTAQPWARHYQSVWHERAGDPRLPQWLRVAALAYGSHTANGHARFKPGQVALVLAAVDSQTGVVTPMGKYGVRDAIDRAIEFGWLMPTSSTTCLVVPGHAIVGGMGKPDAPCPQRHRRRSGGSQLPTEGPKVGLSYPPGGSQLPTVDAVTSANSTALYESSLRLNTQPRTNGHQP